MCHSHIKRHLKLHSKPVAEEKKTTCFLSPKTVYNKERKLKNKMFRAAKRHLLYHCSSFWTNRGSFSQDIATTPAWFIFGFSTHSLFLYALAFQPALPISPEQYTKDCSFLVGGKKKCCTKVCLFI